MSQIQEFESEYLIESASGLLALRDYVNQGSGTTELTFTMTSDVSLSGINWTSIGNGESVSFTGLFNGSGFAIQDLYASGIAGGYQGLFGHVGTAGTITNLVLESGIISGDGNDVGLLVGRNLGTVSNTIVQGTVIVNNTGSNTGGFIGNNLGTIHNVLYDVDSLSMQGAQEFMGGFVGMNSSSITDIAFQPVTSTLTSTQKSVGGFVGSNAVGGSIDTVFVDQQDLFINVTTTDGVLGGFAGRNNATIANINMIVSNHLSLVTNSSFTGGFIGVVDVSTTKNIQMIVESGFTIQTGQNRSGYFIGGSIFSQLPRVVTISGVFLSMDLEVASKNMTSANDELLIGGIVDLGGEFATSLVLNSVYYTSGTTATDSYVEVEQTATIVDLIYDQFSSSGLLSEVTPAFILSIINGDDAFVGDSTNNYPILADTGFITAALQGTKQFPWTIS